ncbi:alsin isoform X2 [Onthophagus taurus]|uniref:alsin isoform X2 n=1 Tax=Onthophagus taurus TaxID=166361 RepID=UPI000C206A1B|nr:alsin isoform X2 [Onthophagus taurus]
MSRFFLWNLSNKLQLRNEIPEKIKKITSISNHIYILTTANNLYHGFIKTNELEQEQLSVVKVDGVLLKDIDCSNSELFGVDLSGKVLKYTDNLEIIKEILLIEDSKPCPHGSIGTKFKMKVEKLSVGLYGNLYITDNGQLWASGNMHQIGINSDTPKRVTFFEERYVYSAKTGSDFAIAIVSKQHNDETIGVGEEILISTCPNCICSSQLTSPTSPNSYSESCPSGIPIPASYDIETTSTSSKSDSTCSNDTKQCINNSGSTENNDNNDKSERNIIFRNTEAAREFLTRQFSWMSSAGEEYLVECTEKPTRIIKENVSNMASLVYEGVKTVGDKVVTLSRHMSGSSDNNEVPENVEEIHLPRVTSKDEFVWSLSQGTSEKDLSEQGLEERCNSIVKNGFNLINCEIWTWGNIIHGQLGLGDIIKRERPMIITKLSNIGAIKISVQSYHAAVLTLDGRAFLWGRNDFNQVTVDSDMDQSSPKMFNNVQSSERVKDLCCGSYHTSVLTYNNELFYTGKTAAKLVKLQTSDISTNDINKKMQNMNNFENNEYFIPNKLFSTLNITGLNEIFNNNEFMVPYLLKEQEHLEQMLAIQSGFIKILQKKNCSDSTMLYENLCTTYMELLHFNAANVKTLADYCNNKISECDVVMFKYVEEHLFIYKNYLNSLYNVLSISGCKYISRILDIPLGLYKSIDGNNSFKKDKKNDEMLINTILMNPYNKLSYYLELFSNMINNTNKQQYHDIYNKWNSFVEEQEELLNDANRTNEFWNNFGKTVENLKKPERRLIRESRSFPINLHNAGLFSSHWFILLNDCFVHINGSWIVRHDLKTIWVEPQQDLSNGQFQISLKMPEETIELYTIQAEDKIQWFHTLQQAIKNALGKSNAHQPPSLRTASYTFTKNGYYKDANYTGRWLNAKMHGSGKLTWIDGKIYTGQFNNNQMHGFGKITLPNIGVYEGQWKDNQQNGFGILKYTNGDVYKGYFKDGQPHGHGSLKQGNFTASSASIYIGGWILGTKNGYGVMHDIVTGDKYLGTWLDNKKHGKGLIVTSEGVYYEGIFNQDVLTGNGLMILEDGTFYEGDFKGTGILGGKGILTLTSGHTLEGNLTGSWNEGIKISNGVLSLSKEIEVSPPKTFSTFCTPVDQKWKSLFRYCHQILGTTEANVKKTPDTQKIWQNVAVVISNSFQVSVKNKSDRGIENSVNNLDTIPQYGRESIDSNSFQLIKQYVNKAFECSYHPLGSLLSDLTVAYTTSYGGLRPHALLLVHAVNELRSITERLFDIVRLLFPALPSYEEQVIVNGNAIEENVVSCQSLLYPIILPRVHSSLFTLYTLKCKSCDAQYWKRLIEWNKQPDYTLMAFLSVNQKFLNSETQEPLSPIPRVKDQHFVEAIETLQLLKTTFSPIEKLNVIRNTFEKMTDAVQRKLGDHYKWNMDDLFPAFLYVVVRARIPQLGSELKFIEDFHDPNASIGELALMFTTLQACYQQILLEKISVT